MVDGERKWCRCGKYPYVTREADGSWRCGYCQTLNDLPPQEAERQELITREMRAANERHKTAWVDKMKQRYGDQWQRFLEVGNLLDEVDDLLTEAAGRPLTRSKGETLDLGSQKNRQAAAMLSRLTEDRSHVLWKRLYELQERGRNLREHIKK